MEPKDFFICFHNFSFAPLSTQNKLSQAKENLKLYITYLYSKEKDRHCKSC